tara:strand:+ start:20 stop:388 length:369 start_codon:yes stop_codon:yes gene_type:complete
MKWIGQHVFDFAIRIRDKLYDHLGSSGSPASSVDIDLSASSTGYAKTLTTDGNKLAWTNATFVHNQGSATTSWSVIHNLNRYPSVTLVTNSDVVVVADVEYTSSNTLTITMEDANAGKAYLN